MNKIGSSILVLAISTLMFQGCAPQPPPAGPAPEVVASPTSVPPTSEPTATATSVPSPTPIPSPTPLPGAMVLPLDQLGTGIPWLPLDRKAMPASYYFYLNLAKPPFDNVMVREAFAAATDREALVEIAQKYGATNAKPATTLTPPQTLGRDLYNVIGIPFNPTRAKELLAEAGYPDGKDFPAIVFLTNATGQPAPGVHQKLAEAAVKMWEENLGVNATFLVLAFNAYSNRLTNDPSEIFRRGWLADYNDPDDFLWQLFRSGGPENYGKFSNSEFDRLVEAAKASNDPAERQQLYIQAERILCQDEVGVIPIFTWGVSKP